VVSLELTHSATPRPLSLELVVANTTSQLSARCRSCPLPVAAPLPAASLSKTQLAAKVPSRYVSALTVSRV
jgi:hypothetical protein